jgi:hypothetical protein
MHLLRMLLIDAPVFVIGVWLKLYTFILAVMCLVLWSMLTAWLLRSVWVWAWSD